MIGAGPCSRLIFFGFLRSMGVLYGYPVVRELLGGVVMFFSCVMCNFALFSPLL